MAGIYASNATKYVHNNWDTGVERDHSGSHDVRLWDA